MSKKWWIVVRGWRIYRTQAIVWTWPVTSLGKLQGEHNEKHGCRMWSRGLSLLASLWRSCFSSLVGTSIFVHIIFDVSYNLFKFFLNDLWVFCVSQFPYAFLLLFMIVLMTFFHDFLLCLLRKNITCINNHKLKNFMVYY